MTFSLDLSDEVLHVRDWVHEFAADVVRPAAAEWDEREETPWPLIQEAAKVGLYTPELFAEMSAAFDQARQSRNVSELQRQLRLCTELGNAAYYRDPNVWEDEFEEVQSRLERASDQARAQALVQQGQEMLGEMQQQVQGLQKQLADKEADRQAMLQKAEIDASRDVEVAKVKAPIEAQAKVEVARVNAGAQAMAAAAARPPEPEEPEEPPEEEGPGATEREEHIGLRGMRERMHLVGGQLRVISRPGQGTRVIVQVPSDA